MPPSTKDSLCKKRKACTKQTKAIQGWLKQPKSRKVPSNTRSNRQWRKIKGLRARCRPLTILSFSGLRISISIVMPHLREPLSGHHRLLTVCWLKPSRDCATKTCKVPTRWAHQPRILSKLATQPLVLRSMATLGLVRWWPTILLMLLKSKFPKASISRRWVPKEDIRDRLRSNNKCHLQLPNTDLNHQDQLWRVHSRDSKAIATITREADNSTGMVRAAHIRKMVRHRESNKDRPICTRLLATAPAATPQSSPTWVNPSMTNLVVRVHRSSKA